MSWITGAISGIGKITSGITNALTKRREMKYGSVAARDQYRHQEFSGAMGQFAGEFQQTNRTWFDSLIDGFNRLPRPVIVTLVIAYFLISFSDPDKFTEINAGLAQVPEPMWWLMSAIVGFYFAARELHKTRQGSKLAPPEPQEESLGEAPNESVSRWKKRREERRRRRGK